MTANEAYPDDGQETEGTEAELTATRRSVLGATGALATAAGMRWDELGYHPDDADDWGELDGMVEPVALDTDSAISSFSEGKWGTMGFERGDFAEETVSVSYQHTGILLSLDGRGEDTLLGASTDLTPDEARELAVGLWQAAEEFEAFDP